MRLLVAVAVVFLLLGGLDVAARIVAENRIADEARSAARGAASAEADIDSFPFVPRLLLAGSVPAVDVRLEQVPARAVRLTAVELELRGVKLHRDTLLGGRARIESIDEGAVAVELDSASLGRALGMPVSIADGRVEVSTGRLRLSVRPEVARNGSLVLRGGGLGPRSLRIGRTGLLSCDAADVSVVADRVRLSCRTHEVPPALRRAQRRR